MGSLALLATVKPVNTRNLSMFVEPAVSAEPKVMGWDNFFLQNSDISFFLLLQLHPTLLPEVSPRPS